jgi:hypothetical protein
MQYQYKTLCALMLIILLFPRCDDKGSVPGYLVIDKIEVQGENNIGICDAKVYINDYLIGTYELPAKVPIIAEGETEVTIAAGIKVNGLSGVRTAYPFYKLFQITRDFEPTESITLSPTVSYQSWADFKYRENFEGDEVLLTTDDVDADTGYVITNIDKFSGSNSLVFYVDTTRPYFEVKLDPKVSFTRPSLENTTGTFLELNYRGTEYLLVGLYVLYMGSIENVDIVYVTPSKNWKKIYVDIGSYISRYTEGTTYSVYLSSTVTTDSISTYGFIDDIRLVQKEE